ncbi:MAG: NADP-dependent malic enzyme [Chloroflexi bacterium]|nr:NADP-dependent malic enzyme [Chloroflexota bacterium]
MSEQKMTVEQLLAKATKPASDAMLLHPFYRGKVETALKCSVRDFNDFAIWYTPGVAAPCKAIAANPELVYEYTNKWNTVIVVSDGTRVLGLGDIGPKAGLPVMEGKALLYKYLGGVDGIAVMVGTKDPDEIINIVLALQPGFGGVNLEDISNPKCFYILDTLREKAEIPVWHDDQQGTATVTLAGLINALKVVNKKMSEVKITFIGTGASNVACSRLIFGWGADPAKCLMVDTKGILGKHRKDLEMRKAEYVDKWKLCNSTNAEGREGDIPAAMRGADVVIALSKSGPGVILPEWVKTMAKDSIVFACANPVPEIWPWEAKETGAAVVATGRSDFPNQVNNSLGFPGIFRGTLDVRARTITDEMCFAAAQALADHVGDKLGPEQILPGMDDWEVFPREAAAVAMKAIEQGLALKPMTYQEEFDNATKIIRRSRQLTEMMMEQGFIPEAPEDEKPPEVDVETVKAAY